MTEFLVLTSTALFVSMIGVGALVLIAAMQTRRAQTYTMGWIFIAGGSSGIVFLVLLAIALAVTTGLSQPAPP